jgi:hypothetical protein
MGDHEQGFRFGAGAVEGSSQVVRVERGEALVEKHELGVL